MNKESWGNKLSEIVDTAISYRPPRDAQQENLKRTAKDFGKELIEHFDTEVTDMSREDKGLYLLKIFATFYLRITQAASQPTNGLEDLVRKIKENDTHGKQRQD